ncbi:hypothetical protein PHYPSEUDO_003674 [Phytophthora pseudosyringae]|uniref:Uncharacterized protein n=1 Tax=Phytophthora pseudosyringae TaxID=221518 RepID=A0A8T1VV89_9STRA|nr:hypothetical protein PHYPSEUDO_003674 [Phytophthora pseudosyringae]
MGETKMEGVTNFASPPAPAYRYIVELKNDKLSISMEDLESKKQWYKGDMSVADYATSANTIPDATPLDYVECFRDALESDLDDSSHMQRQLTVLKGDVLQLELTMHIKFLRFAWAAKFAFDLDPVAVERIDVLESKLRDQKEELEKLRQEVKTIESTSFIQTTATSRLDNGNLCWDSLDSDEFVVNGDDGTVKRCLPGVYTIQAFVQCAPITYAQKTQLQNNGVDIQIHCCIYADGNYSSTPLGITMYFNEGDELSVACDMEVGSSYLSVVRLGG